MTKLRLQVSAVRAQFKPQWLEVVSEAGLAAVVTTDCGAETSSFNLGRTLGNVGEIV